MSYGASKTRDKPGGAHKRNFNKAGRGKFRASRATNAKRSRSRSR
jgi:hypothetical protein